MLIPIRCYTCGKIIADKWEYYERELLRKKLAFNKDEDPLIINVNASEIKKTIAGEIMDELGFHRICCRKVMLTSIILIDDI
jgi:DNA-directed RNA polymerase subunit N (RpoN/RPB10)|uniref:DNA-directed RNA polymerase subunit N n=1 Tax=viral metagenome TaxID=1070528 RepID=A0A6C0HLR8_9ZZZZ